MSALPNKGLERTWQKTSVSLCLGVMRYLGIKVRSCTFGDMAETADNQHFVPQFYLRSFTIPGEKSLIWEFDKQTGQYAKRPKSVRSICSRYRYYRQVRDTGIEEPDMLEHGFSRELERKVAPLHKALLGRLADGKSDIHLTPAEFGQFCYSVAIQYTRVPFFRDKMTLFMKIRGEQQFDQLVEKQRSNGTLPPEVDAMLQKEKPKVIIEDWGTIKTMFEAAYTVSNALMHKTPGFFRVPQGSYFVTSDNPVSYYIKNYEKYDLKQLEPIHPDAEVFFPLSRENAVVFFPYGSGYSSTRYAIRCKCLELLPSLVEYVNMQTVIMAQHHVYAPQKLPFMSKAALLLGKT